MDEKTINQLCFLCFNEYPDAIKRCSEGIGNYVYIANYNNYRYVIRCSTESNAYAETAYWLNRLTALHIPVPKVIKQGKFQQHEFIILSYFEGNDIGLVYSELTDSDKRNIAKDLVQIQNRVASLELKNIPSSWSWHSFIQSMLARAEERIEKNGYFDVRKVKQLRTQAAKLDKYFSAVKPVAYLDDISSKNLLIHNGQISGIIDIDWMGIGDKLTYVALTKMALLNLEYDTDYVSYILQEMNLSNDQAKAFQFYTLLYCVDFMGERGMSFKDKTIEVNPQIIDRLNRIYDILWEQWCEKQG